MKTEGKHAKAYAPTTDELDLMIASSKGVDKLLLILTGKFGMREGEIIHMKNTWIHIGDKQSKIEKIDHIEIPLSGEVCECEKCLLQEYFKLKRKAFRKKHKKDGIETNKDWYRKTEKQFYQHIRDYKILNKERNEKRHEKKLKPIAFNIKKWFTEDGIELKEHTWNPKSDAGVRIIPVMFPEHSQFIKEYFETHDRVIDEKKRITIPRRKIHRIISSIGKKLLHKKIYPHSNRAGLATYLGNNGMSTVSMCAFFGWDDFASARPYIHSEREAMITETKRIAENYKQDA